jgi:simple sugar transport system permease protein
MRDLTRPAPRAENPRGPLAVREFLRHHPSVFTLLLIILVSLVVGAINPLFWQLSTLFDMLRSSVVLGLFALGVLIVLAAGGLDVSFTAIAAFTMYAITVAVIAHAPNLHIGVIMLGGAVGGALFGVLNGLLVYTLRAPSLIVTIGTQYVLRSLLLTFIGTALIINVPEAMESFGTLALWRYQSPSGGRAVLPAFVLVLAVAAGLTWWLLNRTLMGRAIFAIGGNPAVAERLGYNLRVVQIFVFAYAGLLAGIAGIVHVSSNRLANPFDLTGTELDVIAAVILGGARITGGSGTVSGTLLGVVLVTLVNNVLILAGVPSTWQKVIVGAFIVLAGSMFAVRAMR